MLFQVGNPAFQPIISNFLVISCYFKPCGPLGKGFRELSQELHICHLVLLGYLMSIITTVSMLAEINWMLIVSLSISLLNVLSLSFPTLHH